MNQSELQCKSARVHAISFQYPKAKTSVASRAQPWGYFYQSDQLTSHHQKIHTTAC